jgi:hypothetical protein
MQPEPFPDQGIAFEHGTASLLFRTLRDDAFETGNPEAVRAMYTLLCRMMSKQTAHQRLQSQLKAEFGVDVTEPTAEGH